MDRLNRYVNTILNSVRTAFVVMDRSYQIRLWNEAAQLLWGLRAEDVEGKSFVSLDIGLPVAELKETLRRCVAGEEEELEARVDGHDRRGKAMTHVVRCVPLRDGNEKDIRGVIAMVEAQPGKEG